MPCSVPAHLTPTERVVMQRYIDGLSREAIAAELFVSHHAIDKHLKSAKTKLGASNMAQAGALYIEAMLSERDPGESHRRDGSEPRSTSKKVLETVLSADTAT